jgi:predicted N-acetyltransferase YhbS
MIAIREEMPADVAAREALLDAAFGVERSRKTSERLREGRLPALALVAVDEAGHAAGTVRLWHVSAGPGRQALLLGPLAVDSAHRGHGLGGRLMRAALGRAAMLGGTAVLLVGDAPYYGRFGFEAELTQRLWLPGPVARERFLGLELREGALQGAAGLVSATGERRPAPSIAELVAGLETRERAILAEAA